MPMALPLIAAYASISAGVALGTATFASALIGGLMITGGAMTAMGALTHDKTLSQWGGVLGLAGGVAGLANGAWSTAANEVATQSGMDLAADAAPGTANALGGAGNAAVSGMDAAADGMASTIGGTFAPVAPGGLLASATPPPNGMVDPLDTSLPEAGGPATTTAPTQPGLTPLTGQPVAPSATAPAPAVGPAAATPAGTAQPVPTQAAVAPDAVTAPGVNRLPSATVKPTPVYTGNYAKDFVTWAGATPENARLAQIPAGAVGMLGKYYGDQDNVKTQIALQEAANQRARDRINASTRGLAVPTYQPRKG